MQTRKTITLLCRIFVCMCILVLASACFPGPNYVDTLGDQFETIKPEDIRARAGFFRGLWHGIIAPLSFFVSLFTNRISLYEVYNTGGWYDLGFVIGAGILFGGGGCGGMRRRKRNRSNRNTYSDDNRDMDVPYEDISESDPDTEDRP